LFLNVQKIKCFSIYLLVLFCVEIAFRFFPDQLAKLCPHERHSFPFFACAKKGTKKAQPISMRQLSLNIAPAVCTRRSIVKQKKLSKGSKITWKMKITALK
jgi:hypothetical protein